MTGSSGSSSLVLEKLAGPVAPGDFVYTKDRDHVQRRLGKQHIQMVALAGTIGTGLFLGLGQILSLCGPLGSLLVFTHACTVVYATILSLGEMTAFAPITGSMLLYFARWLDPAMGFALGWNYFYYCGIAIPLEISAISALIMFWDRNLMHAGIYISVIILLLLVLNLFGVRWFGNAEIFFASLKITLAVGLASRWITFYLLFFIHIKRKIIGGLVLSLGGGPDHQVTGFKYWQNPGPMVSLIDPGDKGRFVGLLIAIAPAAFSLSGIELISITAAEAQQPRTNVIRAMKTVIFRLTFFFILCVLVVGMLVRSNDPALFRYGKFSGQSPFVLAFKRAGVKALPSIINAVLVTSAFSAANTFVFTASRILYGLSVQQKAPKIFSTCTKDGVPWVAVVVAWLFSFLSFMQASEATGTVFFWFVSLAATCGFLGWLTINITYLRYYYGLKAQRIVPRGIYRSPLQPFASMWAIFWITFYILVSGIYVFWDWDIARFVASYVNLPIFLCFFISYKVWYKTKMIPLADLDFVTNIPTLEETGDEGLLLEKRSLFARLKELV